METMKEKTRSKLASRKLWMAIAGLLLVAATEWLNMDEKLAEQIVGAVVVIIPAYILGQSLPDMMAALKKK